jgi:hypothetical protein
MRKKAAAIDEKRQLTKMEPSGQAQIRQLFAAGR